MTEFELIERYFAAGAGRRPDVLLGIGDDAALLRAPPGHEVVAAAATLTAARCEAQGLSPADVGHRALALALTRLAASGADPAWATLALTLPEAGEAFLQDFGAALAALARRYGVALVGGDTTRGTLTVTVTALGTVPAGRVRTRAGARAGDRIYVTGTPAGSAAAPSRAGVDLPRSRSEEPALRVQAAPVLRDLATAANHLDGGLSRGLGGILEASGVGAEADAGLPPLSEPVRPGLRERAGGGEYELCFTCAPSRAGSAEERFASIGIPWSAVGTIIARTPGSGPRFPAEDATEVP